MVVNKRKKVTRQRGKRWHGWGRGHGHHKGAGNRGGRGRAGSGKRADQKKPSYQKEGKHYLGRIGFKSKSQKHIVAINIKDVEKRLEAFLAQKLVSKKGETYTIDLNELGYNKLLGTGKISTKMEITTDYASKGAITKIEEAGGKVIVTIEPSDDKEAKKE